MIIFFLMNELFSIQLINKICICISKMCLRIFI